MQRRDALKGLLMLGGLGISASVQRALASGLSTTATLPGSFDSLQHELLNALCERIIPATDTPGAVQAGVADFVEQIVFQWYTAAERKIFLDGMHDADTSATARFGGAFSAIAPTDQDALLTELEQQALAVAGPPAFSLQPNLDEDLSPFFAKLKELVVVGYYTSEIGATRELRYERMPMTYQADIPLADVQRAWANGMMD